MGQCLKSNSIYSPLFRNMIGKMMSSSVIFGNYCLFVFIATHLVIFSELQIQSHAHMVGHNPHYRSEILDPHGRYQLEWLVDFDQKKITFNVTVQTKGYVGLGLSQNGTMHEKADIVIGGVTPAGKPYFTDRHSVGRQMPELDARQDWKLNDAWENEHTFLSFYRIFDTCDQDDYPITNDKVSLIWAFGETDTESQGHHQHRGSYDVYLLDPDYSPKIIRDLVKDTPKAIGRDSSDLKAWVVPKRVELSPNETSYLCTIHKGPRLLEKHHLVGFDVHFNSADETQDYVKNVQIYKCNAPHGSHARTMFDPFVDGKGSGQTCFLLDSPQGPMPTDYCTELFHGWRIGGKTYFTPNEVGYPFGLSQDEYYMVQAHYETPVEKLGDAVVEYDLEFYYTNKIRPHDAGILAIGHEIPGMPPSLMIPANSSSHVIFGHCGSECTKLMLPSSGIRIFAVGLHSHNSGRQLRLQHFRNTREMAWISSDNNYSPLHKQIRNLREHVRVLPGDHLIMRCVYDNTWTKGTVVGGFSSDHEQCLAYIHYYNKINEFSNCKSEIISEDYRQRFLGVTNVTWDDSENEYVVDSASSLFESAYLGGLPLSSVSDNHVTWEPETRAEFQRFHRYHPQINTCSKERYARDESSSIGTGSGNPRRIVRSGATRDEYSGATAYPFSSKEYQPEKSCSLQIS